MSATEAPTPSVPDPKLFADLLEAAEIESSLARLERSALQAMGLGWRHCLPEEGPTYSWPTSSAWLSSWADVDEFLLATDPSHTLSAEA